jgi:hypothetical protein
MQGSLFFWQYEALAHIKNAHSAMKLRAKRRANRLYKSSVKHQNDVKPEQSPVAKRRSALGFL